MRDFCVDVYAIAIINNNNNMKYYLLFLSGNTRYIQLVLHPNSGVMYLILNMEIKLTEVSEIKNDSCFVDEKHLDFL